MKASVFRFTNFAILVSLVVLSLTGVISFFWVRDGWVIDIHRIGAWTLLALIPWKVGISGRSLRRGPGKRLDRNVVMIVSLLLAGLIITIIVLALLWTWQVGPQTARGLRLLWWHWILAFVAIIPFLIHVWRRWPRPKKADFTSRRAALRIIGLGSVGLIGWWLAEILSGFRNPVETPRLVTGSRQEGAFTGNDFPITGEAAPAIDTETWRLHIRGAVDNPFSLSAADLGAYPFSESEARLDCTNGWWTVQDWGGVPLETLLVEAKLSQGALAVKMISVTGYAQVFTLKEVQQILVGTHIGGRPLSHWHGAPARAIVPTRRGWFWVKWLSEVEVLDSIDDILVQPFSIR